MRQHKYRGWTTYGREVKGYYVGANENKHFIVQMNCFGELLPNDTFEVDPATVGEFTGKRDSKRTPEFPEGQEIYENDLCRLRPSHGCPSEIERIFQEKVFTIVWSEHEAMFLLEERCDYAFSFDEIDEVLVIGNRYGNPELLIEHDAREDKK